MLGRRLITAAALALCLLVPAGAGAAVEEDEGAIAAFQLKASNGYRVIVLAGRERGQARGDLMILVGSKRGSATYSAKAAVEPSGMQADLGELGRIDLAYVRLKGKEKHACGDEVSRVDRGEYRGTFELHGEEGYTEARATRLKADLGLFLDLVCGDFSFFGDSSGAGLPGARLEAIARRGSDSALSFEIKKNRPSAPAAIDAEAHELKDGVRITRHVESLAKPGAFRYDPRLRSATVSPAAPFDGAATFRRGAPAGKRWTGDLIVDLPGRANIPLTGSEFRLSLVHASWTKDRGSFSGRPSLGRPLALLEAP